MKRIQKYFLMGTMAFAMGLTSCNDEEGIAPSADLKAFNFVSEPGEGEITIKWDVPASNPGFMYMTMVYTDPRDKVTRCKSISPYTEEIVIPNTRARYGDSYSFTFTPYSETDTPGESFTLDKCKSGKAKATTTIEKVPVKIVKYSTNAQEPQEGPLDNLFDNNPSTFFHSQWSNGGGPANHWVTLELGEEVKRFEIATVNRVGGGNNNPREVKLYRLASMDDKEFDINSPFASYKHEKIAQGEEFFKMIPALDKDELETPVKYLRYLAKSSTQFWHLAEMKINKVILHKFDPETDEKEVE